MTVPEVAGNYGTCKPIERNIEIVKQLKASGHTIVINVSRGMETSNGNHAAAAALVGAATMQVCESCVFWLGVNMSLIPDIGMFDVVLFQNLTDFGIPFDELNFSQPHAHFHIGQQNVDPMMNIQKQIGFYS